MVTIDFTIERFFPLYVDAPGGAFGWKVRVSFVTGQNVDTFISFEAFSAMRMPFFLYLRHVLGHALYALGPDAE